MLMSRRAGWITGWWGLALVAASTAEVGAQVEEVLRSELSFVNGGSAAGWHSGAPADSLIRAGESHFVHLWQLTNGGENAEAYFSFSGNDLILQSTPRGAACDQIFTLPSRGGEPKRVSTGQGRCTCSYFFPGDREILFASTHLADAACPPPPDMSHGYAWAIYAGYDIFKADRDGQNLKRLTDSPGYDAEATVGHDGTIVFTSVRDGDLELYSMKQDGSGVKRLTHSLGYDGGAFFSPDGQQICFRAGSPGTPEEGEQYKALLAQGLVKPSKLEIFVMNADGSGRQQLTENGAANFCPFFTPDAKQIIFASNVGDPRGRNFDLYLVDIASKKVAPVTTEGSFDGFPMFSPDGRYLVFASNRGAERPGETNIFLAEWKE